MIEELIAFFKRPQEETKNKAPKGYCPNCWGKQEYDKQIRELYRDKQVEVNNHEANYAFIQDFIVTYLDGIHLKRGNNGLECPTCKTVYAD
jgi:hypothetical protein